MYSKILFSIFLTLTGFRSGFSQSEKPYKTNVNNESITLIIGGSLSALAFYKDFKTVSLDEYQILSLNKDHVNRLDRFAISQHSLRAKRLSDYGLYLSLASAGLIFAPKKARKDWQQIMIMGTEAVLLNYGITNLTKTTFLRNRPFLNQKNPPYDKFSREARYSFISGHASFSAASLMFLSSTLRPYLNIKLTKSIFLGASLAIPIAVATFRVYAGKHFPTDVLAGLLVGGSIGYLVPTLHRNHNDNFSFELGFNRISISYAFKAKPKYSFQPPLKM